MFWTEERTQKLRELWAQGWSASRIAKEIGDGVTRNAVIGKAHRLDLTERPSPIHAAARPARPANVVVMAARACQWPVGDPRNKDFHFCGCAALAGKPYCAEHAARAYSRPAKDEAGKLPRRLFG